MFALTKYIFDAAPCKAKQGAPEQHIVDVLQLPDSFFFLRIFTLLQQSNQLEKKG